MAMLREHKLNLTRGGSPHPERAHVRPLWAALVFVSIAMLVLSCLNHSAIRDVRARISQAMAPVLSAAMVPFDPLRAAVKHVSGSFGLAEEASRLRDENQRLKGWEWRAHELERKLAGLSDQTRLVQDPPLDFITARVIATSSGPFVRSAMINAGAQQNVKNGYPVVSGEAWPAASRKPARVPPACCSSPTSTAASPSMSATPRFARSWLATTGLCRTSFSCRPAPRSRPEMW